MKVFTLLAAVVLTAPAAPYYQEYEEVAQPYAYEDAYVQQSYQAPYAQEQPEYFDQETTQEYSRVPQNQPFIHKIRNAWNRVRNFVTRNPIARQVGNMVGGKAREVASRGIDKLASSINFYQDEEPQYEADPEADYETSEYEDVDSY
jgi:hypothetical protein